MSYDRKLKNAVAKSIKNILAKNSLDIKFSMSKNIDRHMLKVKSVESKIINHFNNNNIKEQLHSNKYIEAVKSVFIEKKRYNS